MDFPSPSRVASRYAVGREAGIFEAPPLVLKAVQDWCLGTYASNVLAQISARLDRKPDESEKRIHKMKGLLESGGLERLVSKLKAEQTVRIPAGPGRDIGLKRVDPEETYPEDHLWIVQTRPGGRFQFPRRPRTNSWGDYDEYAYYEEFLGSAREDADVLARVRRLLEKGLGEVWRKPGNPRFHLQDTRLVELSLMKRECLKYTSRVKAYKTKAATKLPVDLRGWKYIQGIPMNDVGKALAKRDFTEFTLSLFFKAHQSRGGQWSPGNMSMEVDVWYPQPHSLPSLQNGFSSVARICRHEAQHLGQDALRIVKGLWEDAGLPPKELREPGKNPSGISTNSWSRRRIEHPRRDIEFQTRLADEVHKFLRRYKDVPLANRRKFLKNWINTTDFFVANKKNRPKWEKAVSEFYAALDKEGIVFPSAAKSYRVDKSKVPRRDKKSEQESAEEYGFYEYMELDLIPIGDIVSEKAFDENRLKKMRRAIADNKPLSPIEVFERNGKFEIHDGFHRYNASVEAGFPYIPVLKVVTVEAPEKYRGPEPQKQELKPGAWVRLKNPPSYLSSAWAQVGELLGHQSKTHYVTKDRIKRYRYSLVGMKGGKGAFIGDWNDNDWEIGGRPPRDEAEKIQQESKRWGFID